VSSDLPPSDSAFPPPTSSAALCAVHPDRASKGTCDHCGAFSCEDCLGVLGGQYVCRTCVDEGRVQVGLTPWDRREELGVPAAFWQTVTAVSGGPVRFFRELRPDGDLAGALGFLVLVSIPAGFGAAIFTYLQNLVMYSLLGTQPQATGIPLLDMMQGPSVGMAVFQVVFAPVGALLYVLIFALLTHLGLMLVGGASRPLEATIKAWCYSYAVMFWGLIPGGQLITGFWVLAVAGIAMAQVHKTSGWKAAFGVLWFMVGCCCVIFVFVGLAAGLAASNF